MDSSAPALLARLPAIYHASRDLNLLLSAFEDVLLGPAADAPPSGAGLEQKIAGIARILDPDDAPTQFLPWLAQCLALAFAEGLDERTQRELIRNIVPLYTKRGTKAYVEALLEYFTPSDVAAGVDESSSTGLRLGQEGSAALGVSARLGKETPFRFRVIVTEQEPTRGSDERDALAERIRSVVEFAKPAHTSFDIEWKSR